MLADAFADIALGFSAALGGPYGPAIIHSAGTPTIDAGGSISVPGTPTQRECRAQVDSVTDAMRQDGGFVQGDMRILVLSATLTGGITTDDRIEILSGLYAGMWSIESVAGDPVQIGFELRGRKA